VCVRECVRVRARACVCVTLSTSSTVSVQVPVILITPGDFEIFLRHSTDDSEHGYGGLHAQLVYGAKSLKFNQFLKPYFRIF